MLKLTAAQKTDAIEMAQNVLDRLESDRLTRVPLLYCQEIPSVSGIYMAATDEGKILYIGKANDLSKRCKISQHHKIPIAIEKGATHLLIASVPVDLVWHVEQWLISAMLPPLNESVSRWWEEKDLIVDAKPAASSTMPRVRKTFVLDERVMNALDSAAKKAGYKNANQFVEATLFNLLKLSGNLDADAEPLSEQRGGSRTGSGKKPKSAPIDD